MFTPAEATQYIASMKKAVSMLDQLDDESRLEEISKFITEARRTYEELCKNFKYHRQATEAYRAPKIECRELLEALRELKKKEATR